MPRKSKFDLKKLCKPAHLYLVFSLLGLILISLQNIGHESNRLCVGNYNCTVGNKSILFVLDILYILFWTFILDLMCKAGYTDLSWIILLFPILLSFILIGLLIYHAPKL